MEKKTSTLTTIRLNDDYLNMIDHLSQHYDTNKSAVIKKAVKEMYDDMMLCDLAEDFETDRKQGKIKYVSAKQLIEKLKK